MLCQTTAAWAQHQPADTQQRQAQADTCKVNVRGVVYEGEKLQPLEGVTIRLLDPKGQLVSGCSTQANGTFLLKDVPSGTYTAKATYIGYKEQTFSLTLPRKKGNLRVADIVMREDATMLGEATVEGKLPEMTVSDDTVSYNADAFAVEDGAMVEELVKKLPGVEIEDDGTIKWNGKEISQILVDGKEFFGNNRELVLKNIPAETIEKIKAYEKKSDRARITGIDDGNEKTVLDLSVKKDKKRGTFGNISAGGGTHARYQARTNVNAFRGDQKVSLVGNAANTAGDGMTDEQNTGVSMNWQNEKVELNGSLNGHFRQNSRDSRTATQNFESINAAFSNSHNWSSGHNNGMSFQYKVEWKPDTTWNILLRPEVNINGGRNSSDSESATFRSDPYALSDDPLRDYAGMSSEIGVNHRRGSNAGSSDGNSASASLQVNKRLGKPGRNVTLNINGGYNRGRNDSYNYTQTDYYRKKAQDGSDSVYHKTQYNHTLGRNHNVGAGLSYSEPLTPHVFLQLSYSYSYSFRDNSRDVRSIFDPFNDMLGIDAYNYTQFRDSPYAIADRQQSNHTANRYHNHNARLQLRVNRTRYQLTAGISAQPQQSLVEYQKGKIDTTMRRSVANVAPTLNFRYKFSREEQLNIKYNGHSGQPNLIDMIPDTLSDANPLNIRLGNAGLKPTFTHQASLEYHRAVPDRQRASNLNLQFNTTQNSTANRTEYNDDTGGRVTMPVNVNGNWNLRGDFNFNTPLDTRKFWRINASTGAGMSNRIGFVYRSKEKATLKRRTRSGNLSQRLRLTYRREWESKWKLEANANGSFRYNFNRSTNTSATRLDHHNFSYGGSMHLTMPWGTSIDTDINEQSRRGYADKAMNTNRLIWNAGISQRLLPRRNLTLSIRAVDILDQRDDISRNVSATSRSDTETQLVRSYVLFSANLRFGRFGGKAGSRASNGTKARAAAKDGRAASGRQRR